MLFFRCPVFDAAPINSSKFVEERCVPDYVLRVNEANTTANYFINRTSCDEVLKFTKDEHDFFPNCSNLGNMVFISLAAPQVPLVLLEAGCVSTAPFDCLDQVNVPKTITGIVLLGHQDNPLMLLRKTDYQSFHRRLKNSCVAVWCGTETSSCGNRNSLSKKKTRGRKVQRKRQPSEVNKVSSNHKKNVFTSRGPLLAILVILVPLVVFPYLTWLCIKQASAQRHRYDRAPLLESTDGNEPSSLEADSSLNDTEVMTSTRAQGTKIVCAASTQTDQANVRSTETQIHHEMTPKHHEMTQTEHEMTQAHHEMTQTEHKMIQTHHKVTQTDYEMAQGECSSRAGDTGAIEKLLIVLSMIAYDW